MKLANLLLALLCVSCTRSGEGAPSTSHPSAASAPAAAPSSATKPALPADADDLLGAAYYTEADPGGGCLVRSARIASSRTHVETVASVQGHCDAIALAAVDASLVALVVARGPSDESLTTCKRATSWTCDAAPPSPGIHIERAGLLDGKWAVLGYRQFRPGEPSKDTVGNYEGETYALEDGKWRLVEKRDVLCETEDGFCTLGLPAAKKLKGATWAGLRNEPPNATGNESAERQKELETAWKGGGEPSFWVRLDIGSPQVYFRMLAPNMPAYPTSDVVWRDDAGRPSRPPEWPFEAGEGVIVQRVDKGLFFAGQNAAALYSGGTRLQLVWKCKPCGMAVLGARAH